MNCKINIINEDDDRKIQINQMIHTRHRILSYPILQNVIERISTKHTHTHTPHTQIHIHTHPLMNITK